MLVLVYLCLVLNSSPSTSKVGVSVIMDVELLLVPYDTARRGWRCGAGPEHLVMRALSTGSRARATGSSAPRSSRMIPPSHRPRSGRPSSSCAAWPPRFETPAPAGHFPLILSGNCNVAATGALSWAHSGCAIGLLVRCPRGVQHSRYDRQRLPGRDGTVHQPGLVLASHGRLRAWIPARPGRSHFPARRARPGSSRSSLAVRLPGKPGPRLSFARPVRPARPVRRHGLE
jgi:hypothetical protein